MRGRVAVLKAYGGEFELREYAVPDPEPGAVLVRLTRAGVCGSDLHIWRGEMKEVYGALPKDLTFGHEMCGRVERLGAGVTVDSAGAAAARGRPRHVRATSSRAVAARSVSATSRANCPRKARANRVAGTPPYFNNAYGDYYYLRPGASVFRMPDEVSDDVATPANCALAQVLYGLTRAGVRLGDTVVVQGAGGLGLNAVAVARDMGAERVIVIDRVPSRLELARAFGADHTLSLEDLPTPERRIEAVVDLTGGFGADVVADFVGYPEVVPEGLRMLRSGGCYLEVGSIAPGQRVLLRRDALVRNNTRLVGTSNYSPWALAEALAFLARHPGALALRRASSPTSTRSSASARPSTKRTGCSAALTTASASPAPRSRCPDRRAPGPWTSESSPSRCGAG